MNAPTVLSRAQVRDHTKCLFGVEPCMTRKPWCAHKDTFKVFVYPDGDLTHDQPELMQRSDQMKALLAVLRSSRYVTDDPAAACLFIPSVDTLCTANKCVVPELFLSTVLPRLQYWNSGEVLVLGAVCVVSAPHTCVCARVQARTTSSST